MTDLPERSFPGSLEELRCAAADLTEHLNYLQVELENATDPFSLDEKDARDEAYDRMDEELLVREAKSLASDLKSLAHAVQERLDRRLPSLMAQAGMPRGDRNGRAFFPTPQIFVSPVGGINDPHLHQWLETNGYSDVVKNTVHAGSLKAVVKEVREAHGGELPAALAELVKVTEVTSISVKKS